MSKKEVYFKQIGPVLIQKRRGNRNLRLSISAQGKIRVSQPTWTPFSAGVAFARNNHAWIKQHMKAANTKPLKNSSLIGKHHRLVFKNDPELGETIKQRLTPTELLVTSGLELSHPLVQERLIKLCEKALRQESKHLLAIRLKQLAVKFHYQYKELKIKKLSARWGSCSEKNDITLSLYLVQLPWHLIDYVLAHELVHTVHKHHGADFWQALEQIQPGARRLRKELHDWQPRLTPSD